MGLTNYLRWKRTAHRRGTVRRMAKALDSGIEAVGVAVLLAARGDEEAHEKHNPDGRFSTCLEDLCDEWASSVEQVRRTLLVAERKGFIVITGGSLSDAADEDEFTVRVVKLTSINPPKGSNARKKREQADNDRNTAMSRETSPADPPRPAATLTGSEQEQEQEHEQGSVTEVAAPPALAEAAEALERTGIRPQWWIDSITMLHGRYPSLPDTELVGVLAAVNRECREGQRWSTDRAWRFLSGCMRRAHTDREAEAKLIENVTSVDTSPTDESFRQFMAEQAEAGAA